MKIVGIMLIQNEDIHLNWAIKNIVPFCDDLLIFDNMSRDGSSEIIKEWTINYSKIKQFRIKDPRESHDALQPYINTKTWVFAVDGDEIYDPIGLKQFRTELEEGLYDHTFSFYGHTLNCSSIDTSKKTASGYMTPESKSVTKLYNFSAITRWNEVPCERLHGGIIEFNAGYHYNLKYPYCNQVSWDEAKFRCLHACFLRRSTLDKKSSQGYCRPNIYDLNGGVERAIGFKKLLNQFKKKLLNKSSKWKQAAYKKGSLVTIKIDNFS